MTGGETSATRARVLVVDDSVTSRLVAARFLETLGCRVETAEDGLEALNKAKLAEYDLVLMDCEMPGMDGSTATRLLRRLHARLPILITSAHEECTEALEAGADGVLEKPLTRARLEAALAEWTQPAAAAGEPPVLDAAVISGLTSMCGPEDRDFLRQVAAAYEEACRAGSGRIARAAEQGELAELASAAHALRGSSLNAGATRVAALCAELEEARQVPPPGRLVTLAVEIETARRAWMNLADEAAGG